MYTLGKKNSFEMSNLPGEEITFFFSWDGKIVFHTETIYERTEGMWCRKVLTSEKNSSFCGLVKSKVCGLIS